METITELMLVAFVTIYVVDLSGFSETLTDFVSAWLGRRVSQLKPFTCSLCMVWWACLAYLLVSAKLTLPLVAFSALLSFLTYPIGQLLVFIREGLLWLTNRLLDLL